MAFKDVAVGRMVSQARMMKQFDHIVSPAARAVETLPSLLQHGARSHARAVLALTPPGPPPPLLLRSRHHVPAQSSDEELRDEWERDPDLITKAITRTTHGSVRSAYVQAQEKSMVRRPRFPLPAAHAALLAADRSPSHKTIQARCVATRLCASASLSQEMKELLRDIEEVSKMAAEIAELVEARSETIQSIVGNVDMANDYGEGGAPSASNWVGGRARPPAPRRLRQCRSNLLSVAPGHPPPPLRCRARSEARRALAREGAEQHAGGEAPHVLLRNHRRGCAPHCERSHRRRARRRLRSDASRGRERGLNRVPPKCV